MTDILIRIAQESWNVLGDMAPYLLLGFLIAGFLSVCFSPAFVQRHLGDRGYGPVVKAAALGVPLPLCSCGVIPVSASLRRHGASRAAVTSFLLSTPQTGIDSIAITFALLGTVFAVFRPLVALATGLLGGLLVMLFDRSNGGPTHDEPHSSTCGESCCTGGGHRNLLWRALEYGLVALPRDIGGALLVGVLIAGVLATFVEPNQWQPYLGGGIVSILLAMLVGVPLYVCASASVPIAAGLMHAGASPGAALAFLIAGPATNAATIATVWRVLGRGTALLYLLTVAISAIGGGLLLDWLFASLGATVPYMAEHGHEMGIGAWPGTFWGILLLGVIAYSYAARPRAKDELADEIEDEALESEASQRVELTIIGMRCSHCASAVDDALRDCRGVASVQVDLAAGRAIVLGAGVDADELIASVKSLGYRADVAPAGPSGTHEI